MKENEILIKNAIAEAIKHGSNPIEYLKILQNFLVTGRQLNIARDDETVDGDINAIIVDRDNILATTFAEMKYIENFRQIFRNATTLFVFNCQVFSVSDKFSFV